MKRGDEMNDILITTKRLNIRKLRGADAQLLYEYSQQETARRELPDEVQASPQEAGETIESLRSCYGQGYPLVYALAERETDQLLGHISLSEIPEGVEIGYAVSETCQGKGYAAEAIAAFSQWALQAMEPEILYAVIKEKNLPSRRVAEKAGYRLLSVTERDFLGDRGPTAVYVFTAQTRPDNE